MVLKVTQCNIWTNVENDQLRDPSFGSQFVNRHIKELSECYFLIDWKPSTKKFAPIGH